jgi:hypothetical protein
MSFFRYIQERDSIYTPGDTSTEKEGFIELAIYIDPCFPQVFQINIFKPIKGYHSNINIQPCLAGQHYLAKKTGIT